MHYMYVSLNYDLVHNICGPQQLKAASPRSPLYDVNSIWVAIDNTLDMLISTLDITR
jgi:hypothetical protein